MIFCNQHTNPGMPHLAYRISPTLVLFLAIIGLSGCGGDQTTDLQQYINEVKTRKKSNIPPLPKPEEFEQFTYNDNGLRDPFEPIEKVIEASAQANNGLQPDFDREKDVLEQFKLGSLKMMGSLEKNGTRWALIRTADGTLYRTTVGRHLGQDNGEILKITETQLELREIIPDGLGGYVERFSTLAVSE